MLKLLFQGVLTLIRECGPVTVLSEKTRIAFHKRMSFMVVSVQQSALRGHFVFARRIEHPRFLRIETFSPRNHVHQFRLTSAEQLDAEFKAWIAEAYSVGEQRHIRAA